MYEGQRLHSTLIAFCFVFFFSLCSKMWVETNSSWFQSPNSQREAKTEFLFPNHQLRPARRHWRYGLGLLRVTGEISQNATEGQSLGHQGGKGPWSSHFFAVVVQSLCPILYNPMEYSKPGFPILHRLLEFAQVHVHWVDDALWPSHPLPPSSPFAFNLSKHQGLLQWVSSFHQGAKVLELHQSFQWIFRVDFL